MSSSSQLNLPISVRPEGRAVPKLDPLPKVKRPRGRAAGGAGGRGGGPGGPRTPSLPPPPIPDTSLAEEAERRYLNYALSVITSRALPDARDGLKPVQRRILYAMIHDLHLNPEARFRKSAAVVGEVMGKYHPHGDVALYDAMVRMAQPFAMRATLVDGHGNFGSPDGDSAAAMRYTEAKLRPLAMELLRELGQQTVDFRPNYDGTRDEPTVLPARFPNLLVNGSYGIAVGMATSIPPHNLGEVVDACVCLIDSPELKPDDLLRYIKGPDFPTGGQLQASRQELVQIYATGQGSIKLRGQWTLEPSRRRGEPDVVVISSVPYGIERRVIVERIAEEVLNKKLPGVLDVRDESTEQVRVVLELKRDADPQLVMAYLFKHTPLATSVQVNLTALVPPDQAGPPSEPPRQKAAARDADDAAAAAPAESEEQPAPRRTEASGGVPVPRRLSLQRMLLEFLDFRFLTVTRRLEYDLAQLLARIHVLEGFEIIFDQLTQAIAIIRKSDGKEDAAAQLIGRFGLSDIQADAILELKLYRLSRLEIEAIVRELSEKRAQARKLRTLLNSDSKRWALVREELCEIKSKFAEPRCTEVVSSVAEPDFQAEDFIVDEDWNVIVSTSGWIKRLREVRDLGSTRLREGDSVLAAVVGSTRAPIAFFSNHGICYVCRVHDVPPSTGYGDPVQKLFKLGDGERVVAALCFDPRVLAVPAADETASEPEPPYALAVTKRGLGLRFSLRNHAEPSTRAGRKFARLNEGDEILNVITVGLGTEPEWVMCAANDGHALAVPVAELPVLAGAGKGVHVIKLGHGAELLGVAIGRRDLDAIMVETGKGASRSLTLRSIEGPRGGRGSWIVKRDGFTRFVPQPVDPPSLEATLPR